MSRKKTNPRVISPYHPFFCLFFFIVLLINCILDANAADTSLADPPLQPSIWDRIACDHRAFYSWENGIYLAFGFSAGAVMANTSIDKGFSSRYQKHWRSQDSDDIADFVKAFGEYKEVVPWYLGLAILGNEHILSSKLGFLGEWGERNTRAIIVGVPPLLFMQRVTGASRPDEDNGSRWRFWQDNNGVSGHSFIGAIPFLTAARMVDNLPAKMLLYPASTLAGWSRVNDKAHYLSQSLLGWIMAWRAVNSVESSTHHVSHSQVLVMPLEQGAMLTITMRM